jgi:hypothetical protein
MKTLLSSVLVTVTLGLAPQAVAQITLTANLNNITLEPNLKDQVRDITIQNTGTASLDNILGMDFVMQIGNGSTGPKIQSVSLSAGNSIFAGNVSGEALVDSTSWTVFYEVDATSTLSLPASGPATLLARVTFDTTGLLPNTQWTASLKDVSVAGTPYSTSYLFGTGSPRPLDTVLNGTISVVPEPVHFATVSGLSLLGLALGRRISLRRNGSR